MPKVTDKYLTDKRNDILCNVEKGVFHPQAPVNSIFMIRKRGENPFNAD